MSESESVLAIGSANKLVGIHTAPPRLVNSQTNTPLTGANDDLVVLIINSGLLNKAGPFRLHVELARKLACSGLACYRFDLSGIGDSDRVVQRKDRNAQHLIDIKVVMDYFEKKEKVKRFVIVGICTGADNAHKMMIEDDRVVGAVCIDGYAYPTTRYYLNRYLEKIFDFTTWLNLAKKVKAGMTTGSALKSEPESEAVLRYRWVRPPKEQVKRDYQEFISRGVKLLCVYTSSWPYNYKNQLADSFRSLAFENVIQVAYIKNAEHTYPLIEARERLINTLLDWFAAEF